MKNQSVFLRPELNVSQTNSASITQALKNLELAKKIEKQKIKKGYKSMINREKRTEILVKPENITYYEKLGYKVVKNGL